MYNERDHMKPSAEKRDNKEGSDRRRGPTPMLSRYTFVGGQRRTARRREDRSRHVFVDLYSTRLLVAVLALATLSIMDAFCTLALVKEQVVVEANPVMAYYLSLGDSSFLAVKILITMLSITVFCLCKNFRVVRVSLLAVVFLYFSVVMYEFGLIQNFLSPFHVLPSLMNH
jgi:hypothetical protein